MNTIKVYFKYTFNISFLTLCFILSNSVFNISSANASGFAIYTHGAASLAQSAATIAHSDHASSVFFNPALINTLDDTQIEAGTTLILPSRKFTSNLTGKSREADSRFAFPSTFFATHKFNESVSAGFGVFNPFGLSTHWPEDWEGRYIATTSVMKTYNVNPVFSYRHSPMLTVAAGLNFLLLDARLEKKINFQSLELLDGNQKLEGDGEGYGYNLCILLEPHPDIALGASFRSEIEVDICGHASYHVPTNIAQNPLTAFPDTDAMSNINLPEQFHLGIAYKGLPQLTIEAAVRWEGWSSFDALKVELKEPITLFGESTRTFITKRDWQDTWTGSLGLKYRISERVSLMGGYLYQGNPVPDRTFDPSIPDANAHLFSFGVDMEWNSFHCGLAIAYQDLKSRQKSNSVDDNPNDSFINPKTSANEKYDTELFLFGVEINYTF